MFKKIMKSGALSLCMGLVLVAEVASSTSTFWFFYEPDCPEELIK